MSKKPRRKSCENEMFGGINFYSLKVHNIKSPKSEKLLQMKNAKIKLGWKFSTGHKFMIPFGKNNKKIKKLANILIKK